MIGGRSSANVSDRGCPLRTVIDRPMWHAGGTAGEDDVSSAWPRWAPAWAMGEVHPGDPQPEIGKPPKAARQRVLIESCTAM